MQSERDTASGSCSGRPERFDISRRPDPHLGFGGSGPELTAPGGENRRVTAQRLPAPA
jgi:hypothetical protein